MVKTSDQSLIQLLDQLGFTGSDAEVYLVLARKGASSAGPLVTETGLHRNVVYTALAHLVARKLVAEKSVRGTKRFSVAQPQILLEEYRTKQEQAVTAVEAIDELRSQDTIGEITVHEGNEEYLALLTGLLEQLPRGSTKYVLGAGGESFMKQTMRPIWKAYHKVALERGIRIKMIAYENQRAAIAQDIQDPPIYTIRYLSDDIENPSGIHIYPEASTVLNIIYSDEVSPVTAVKMLNPKLVKGYRHFFDNLWKTAKL